MKRASMLLLALACAEEPAIETDAGTTPLDGGTSQMTMLAPLTDVCPRGNQTPIIADANGDGIVDVADAVAIENRLIRRGINFPCPAAANFDGDSSIELDDAERISTYLVTGQQIPRPLAEGACDAAAPWPDGTCAPLALDLVGPGRVTADHFALQVVLRSPELDVSALSLSLGATACTIDRVTFEGTTAAEVWDRPPGIRHLGFATATTVDGGAIAYLILSATEDITFPRTSDPIPILSIEASASVPSTGCAPCTIALEDGRAWKGQPIDTVVVAEGRSYRPALARLELDVCAE